MEHWLIFVGLTGTLLQVSFAGTYHYYFIRTSLNWGNAQTACRRNYTDMATIENSADVEAVKNLNYTVVTGKAWIGLYDELVNSWKWSLSNSSFYGNWDSAEPTNIGGIENCVVLYSSTGKWHDYPCSSTFHFVCYNGIVNNRPSFVLVNEYKNWTAAQTHCRGTYIDLVSVRTLTENNEIKNLTGSEDVWIGLYREKLWSDGSTSLFRYWANGQPNSAGATCTAAAFGNQEGWFDEACSLSLPFICYRQRGQGIFASKRELVWERAVKY
uniref:C-type lectin domain-containing protein n=1 Tax=Poecilia formosa TaxID=48698 RepID=A0A096LZI4_POEFO